MKEMNQFRTYQYLLYYYLINVKTQKELSIIINFASKHNQW